MSLDLARRELFAAHVQKEGKQEGEEEEFQAKRTKSSCTFQVQKTEKEREKVFFHYCSLIDEQIAGTVAPFPSREFK